MNHVSGDPRDYRMIAPFCEYAMAAAPAGHDDTLPNCLVRQTAAGEFAGKT